MLISSSAETQLPSHGLSLDSDRIGVVDSAGVRAMNPRVGKLDKKDVNQLTDNAAGGLIEMLCVTIASA